MPQLESFIPPSHRPEINGGRLDKSHKAIFYLDNLSIHAPFKTVKTITFGPKQDKVLLNLEHAIEKSDQILVFYYEDLHIKWTFIETNDDRYFLCRINENEQYRIKARNLYIRGCQVDVGDNYWQLIGEFYNFVDNWPGRIICAPRKQANNESKLYQLCHSLKKASQSCNTISIGHSYVLKGHHALARLDNNKSYITKSLSGIRSIVVDDKTFKTWHEDNICHLPVLIQEKVSGHDIRIHVVNGNLHGKLSLNKSEVDYRYDNNFFKLIDYGYVSSELQTFCIATTEYEENTFMGIDFIKTPKGYVVLEANPSPGWSAYQECNGIENDSFMQDLLKELKDD